MQLKLPFVSNWVTLLLVVAIYLIAYLSANYQRQFKRLLRSFFSRSKLDQLIREESGVLRRVQISMNLIYFLVFALLLNKYILMQQIQTKGFLVWLVIFIALVVIYVTKFIVIKLLGEMFNLKKMASEYAFNVYLLHQFNVVILLPLAVLSYYVANIEYESLIIYIASIVIAISLIVRLFKLLQIGTSYKGFSILYLFIYICTLEILPMAIGYKILIYR